MHAYNHTACWLPKTKHSCTKDKQQYDQASASLLALSLLKNIQIRIWMFLRRLLWPCKSKRKGACALHTIPETEAQPFSQTLDKARTTTSAVSPTASVLHSNLHWPSLTLFKLSLQPANLIASLCLIKSILIINQSFLIQFEL